MGSFYYFLLSFIAGEVAFQVIAALELCLGRVDVLARLVPKATLILHPHISLDPLWGSPILILLSQVVWSLGPLLDAVLQDAIRANSAGVRPLLLFIVWWEADWDLFLLVGHASMLLVCLFVAFYRLPVFA